MAENVVHKFPDILDEDMNRELYLLTEEEIQEETYNTIKAGYGVIGPDFQIVEKNGAFFLKGDMAIEDVEECVNAALASKGIEAVFPEEDTDDNGGEGAE